MSHFSRIKTSIRDLSTLQAVLTQLDISWEKNDQTLEVSNTSLDLVLHQPNSTDLGFTFNGYEYEFVIDKSFWQQAWSVESFVSRINQTYTAKLLNEELVSHGFSTVRCVKTQQGVIDLVGEKWVDELTPNYAERPRPRRIIKRLKSATRP
jgi:hypothetical protein